MPTNANTAGEGTRNFQLGNNNTLSASSALSKMLVNVVVAFSFFMCLSIYRILQSLTFSHQAFPKDVKFSKDSCILTSRSLYAMPVVWTTKPLKFHRRPMLDASAIQMAVKQERNGTKRLQSRNTLDADSINFMNNSKDPDVIKWLEQKARTSALILHRWLRPKLAKRFTIEEHAKFFFK